MSDERPTPERSTSGLDPDEIEELRASVAALREEISTRFGVNDDPEPRAAPRDEPERPSEPAPTSRDDLDPPASPESASAPLFDIDAWELWDRARGVLANLGMRSRQPETDDFGMDLMFLERVRPVLDFLVDRWWRVRVEGEDVLPDAEGTRILFIANRSGVLPYDGLVISHVVERARPGLARPRFLVADWLATLPVAQPALARIGGVRACRENAERLLTSGRPVIAFPEGQKGALKPFSERYRLQRFGRGGFVPLAIAANAVVVPVAVIGAEEAHPILYRSNLLERVLGVPLPLTPTFPHLGPLGAVPLPSQWRLRFGAPVRFDEEDADRATDPLYVNRARERIRGTIQELVDDELHQRSSVWS